MNVMMDVCRKRALERNDLVGTLLWVRLIAGAVFAVVFAFRLHSGGPLIHDSGAVFGLFGAGLSSLTKYLIYLVLDTALVTAAMYFYLGALQHSDLSVCTPFLSFTPVLLIPSGYLFLHEAPNIRQLLGVLLVVCGSLAMNREAFHSGWRGPFRAIFRETGSRYVLYVAVILAVTNPMDKILVIMSDAVTYAFGYGAMLCIFFSLLMLGRRGHWTDAIRIAPGWILMAGLLDASVLLLQFSSHRFIDVFLTITIKRAGVILSVLAGWLVFREKKIDDRLFAAATMLGGVVMIYIPMGPLEQATTVTVLLTLVVVRVRASLAPLDAADRIEDDLIVTTSGTSVVVPEKPKLRCAILGCGQIAQEYLRAYRTMDCAEVTVCIDIDETRASLAAAVLSEGGEYKITVSGELSDALTKDVDVVIISTPNHLHREHALAALKSGKHILLQKPLANSLPDALEIVEAAECHGMTSGIYMSYFDQPVIHDLRGMARNGCLGEVTQIHMRLMHSGGIAWSALAEEGESLWRCSVEQTGGGAFIQLAVHAIRLLTWLLGDKVTRVQGFAANRLCAGLEGEDSAAAILEFESGTYATLNISWCASGEEIAVHGSSGSFIYRENRFVTVKAPCGYSGFALHYDGGDEASFDCLPPALGDGRQPFNQHRLFLEAVRDGMPPFVSLRDGLYDLAVVAAFYESVRTGGSVFVEAHAPRLIRTS